MLKKLYLIFFILSNLVAMDHTQILIMASKDGNIEKIRELINKKCNLDVRDANNGHTALIWASKRGHLNIVKLLLEAGADVNELTNIGMTALMWAKIFGHKEIEILLTDAGAIDSK